MLLEALASLLRSEGYTLHAYSTASEFLADQAKNLQASYPGPRCVISDINMRGMSGLELQKHLEIYPDLPVILMSGVKKPDNVIYGFRAGALDFLIKPVEAEELFEAVEKALRHSEQVVQATEGQALLGQKRGCLTDRELAVVRLVAQGWLNKQIADELNIALRTVKLHRQRALEKLGLQKSLELVPLLEAGII